MNLYAYCGNNPVVRTDIQSMRPRVSMSGSVASRRTHIPTTFSTTSSNSSNIHFKGSFFETDFPSFFKMSRDQFEILSWDFCFAKGSMHFDNEENHSLYIALGNISSFVGMNYKTMKYGIELGANLISIGYDGKFIDVSADFLGVGAFASFEKGKLKFKLDPPGAIGIGVSFDFGFIFTEFFNFLING